VVWPPKVSVKLVRPEPPSVTVWTSLDTVYGPYRPFAVIFARAVPDGMYPFG
jgi:hypothetical protein